MTGHLLDFFFLASFSGVLVSVAAAGILVLPWQDDEMDDTVAALKAAGRLFERLAHHAGDTVRRLESMDRGTHVFEPPTMPAR
jgi:hypothetical protein